MKLVNSENISKIHFLSILWKRINENAMRHPNKILFRKVTEPFPSKPHIKSLDYRTSYRIILYPAASVYSKQVATTTKKIQKNKSHFNFSSNINTYTKCNDG